MSCALPAVQFMINELIEHRSSNSGTAMPTGDKQHPVSVKKVPLRELPNETRNIIAKSPGSSPLPKDRPPPGGLNTDTSRLSGTKRQQPDSPSSASTLQPTANNGVNGHLVYVRRKLDTEPGKIIICDSVDGADFPDLRKSNNGLVKEPNTQQDPTQVPKTTPLPVPVVPWTPSYEGISLLDFVGKPFIGLAGTEPDSVVTDGIPVQVVPQRSSNLDWKERFLRLQIFLKKCDQTSQEDYIQKLRSLSAAGRSKHAVELEKRAIQLLLEEGKELHRMKVLNVLGKALPKENTPLSAQTPSTLQVQFPRGGMIDMIDVVRSPLSRNG